MDKENISGACNQNVAVQNESSKPSLWALISERRKQYNFGQVPKTGTGRTANSVEAPKKVFGAIHQIAVSKSVNSSPQQGGSSTVSASLSTAKTSEPNQQMAGGIASASVLGQGGIPMVSASPAATAAKRSSTNLDTSAQGGTGSKAKIPRVKKPNREYQAAGIDPGMHVDALVDRNLTCHSKEIHKARQLHQQDAKHPDSFERGNEQQVGPTAAASVQEGSSAVDRKAGTKRRSPKARGPVAELQRASPNTKNDATETRGNDNTSSCSSQPKAQQLFHSNDLLPDADFTANSAPSRCDIPSSEQSKQNSKDIFFGSEPNPFAGLVDLLPVGKGKKATSTNTLGPPSNTGSKCLQNTLAMSFASEKETTMATCTVEVQKDVGGVGSKRRGRLPKKNSPETKPRQQEEASNPVDRSQQQEASNPVDCNIEVCEAAAESPVVKTSTSPFQTSTTADAQSAESREAFPTESHKAMQKMDAKSERPRETGESPKGSADAGRKRKACAAKKIEAEEALASKQSPEPRSSQASDDYSPPIDSSEKATSPKFAPVELVADESTSKEKPKTKKEDIGEAQLDTKDCVAQVSATPLTPVFHKDAVSTKRQSSLCTSSHSGRLSVGPSPSPCWTPKEKAEAAAPAPLLSDDTIRENLGIIKAVLNEERFPVPGGDETRKILLDSMPEALRITRERRSADQVKVVQQIDDTFKAIDEYLQGQVAEMQCEMESDRDKLDKAKAEVQQVQRALDAKSNEDEKGAGADAKELQSTAEELSWSEVAARLQSSQEFALEQQELIEKKEAKLKILLRDQSEMEYWLQQGYTAFSVLRDQESVAMDLDSIPRPSKKRRESLTPSSHV